MPEPAYRKAMIRKYEREPEWYAQVRERFLAGETIRQIALKENLLPLEVVHIMDFIGKEFDIERSIRCDQIQSKVNNMLLGMLDRLEGSADFITIITTMERLQEFSDSIGKSQRDHIERKKILRGPGIPWQKKRQAEMRQKLQADIRAAMGMPPEARASGSLEEALYGIPSKRGRPRKSTSSETA